MLEAALPGGAGAPYREHLTALQDSAPPMPTPTVREQLTAHLGAGLARAARLARRRRRPRPRRIGQVHRGALARRPRGGRQGAVPRRRRGADRRPAPDRPAWPAGVAPVFPGIDIKPLVAELQARAADELDYHLEAEAQAAFAEAFRDDPDIVVPDVVAVGGEVLVTEWLESRRLAGARSSATGTQEERDHYGELLVRFLFAGPARTGMLHADPHPGQLPRHPRAATASPAGSASSTSAPSPGCPQGSSPRRWAG